MKKSLFYFGCESSPVKPAKASRVFSIMSDLVAGHLRRCLFTPRP